MGSAESLEQAVALHQAMRLDEAAAKYHELIARDPRNAEALHLLGVLEHQQKRPVEAEALIRRAILLNPNNARFHNNLGEVFRVTRRLSEAVAAYRHAIALRPAYPEALNNLGLALDGLGQRQEAIDAFRAAIRAKPDYFRAMNNLAIVLSETDQTNEAISLFEVALRLKPDYVEGHNNFANALAAYGKLGPAEAHFRKAIRLNPKYANAYAGLGATLSRQGRLDESIDAMRESLRLAPEPKRHSNLLYTLPLLSTTTPKALLDECKIWSQTYAEPLRSEWRRAANPPDTDRRLRIGYVSPDLRTHPIAFFLEPILASHDASHIETYIYASVTKPDEVTARLRGYVHQWRDGLGQDDAELAAAIRADQIDVLIDLSVHMSSNRLLTFARKPAPVQVSYLAYPSTTGLPAVDYRLSDAFLDPPQRQESHDVEQLARLSSYFCFRPAESSPSIGPSPAAMNGYSTFASANTLQKLSPACYAAWAEILSRMPRSRLIFQAMGLNDPATCDRVRERFAALGIDPSRLEFIGFAPLRQFLEMFNRVDIALDAFPYSSGTTTCHSLWMGVPVISLIGSTAVQRMGYSVLANAGLAEFAVASVDAYVRKAIDLASDAARLNELRSALRPQLSQSRLMDALAHTRELESLYRMMWKRYCSAEK